MELLEFFIKEEAPSANVNGRVELWTHKEGLVKYVVFTAWTSKDNHEAILDIARTIRGNFPMTMPNHFNPLMER